MTVVRWSWLGDHLAVDLANTVRRRGMRYVDLIGGPDDLAEWLAHEADRLATPDVVDDSLVERFTHLRDLALDLLRAAASGSPLPGGSRHALNDIAIHHPAVRLLGDVAGPGPILPLPADNGASALIGHLAAAVIDLLTRPDLAHVALCDAPGCGQLYHRARPNQQWCGPGCGTRARSERHHRRHA